MIFIIAIPFLCAYMRPDLTDAILLLLLLHITFLFEALDGVILYDSL